MNVIKSNFIYNSKTFISNSWLSMMKNIFVLITLLTTSLLVQANDYLKPEEVKSLLVGKKVLGRFTSGAMIDFQLNEDNTSSTSASGGDTGKWRLNEEGYCVSWVKIRKGSEMCFRVTKRNLGQHFVVAPDGTHVQLVRID
jgi:hypothetical protein